jgi:hypothetical protein
VFEICKRHEAAGAKALHGAPSGRKNGDGRLLEAAQEAMVRKLIADKMPGQMKMPCGLWARKAVAQLIEQRFGIRLPVRTKLQLVKFAARDLRSVQRQPERV